MEVWESFRWNKLRGWMDKNLHPDLYRHVFATESILCRNVLAVDKWLDFFWLDLEKLSSTSCSCPESKIEWKKSCSCLKKYEICLFVSVNYQILLIIFLLQKNLIWEGIHLQQEKLPLSVLLSHYCDKKAIGCTGQQNILTSKPLNFFLYKSASAKHGRETITARKLEVLEKI